MNAKRSRSLSVRLVCPISICLISPTETEVFIISILYLFYLFICLFVSINLYFFGEKRRPFFLLVPLFSFLNVILSILRIVYYFHIYNCIFFASLNIHSHA